ncbi:MAG: pyridoxamine 5'-phosphate oxidase family protein [Candidatus Peregrinibacteria bacterium]|nr:pyridoxamine 5'-phosphate oxidase family protein [Candidatus Peregrinibacteria bacterium]MCB9808268.1 pyridoxamine 5'-phosphate oxidase family protein [Candidatus Peribacteria bacterium]
MSSKLQSRAKEIIDGLEYVTISTADADGEPWGSPVTAFHDEDYNFYWISWVEAQHSQNIRNNRRAFITIFDSKRQRGDNHRRGVYVQASAEQIDDEQMASEALQHFHSNNRTYELIDHVGNAVKRVFKATPKRMWLNNLSEKQVTEKTTDMRIEVPLPL